MKIGDLSKEIDLSIQTIRFYEKEGLIGLPERTEGRFRIFSAVQRDRLVFIKTMRELGFPLEEVRAIISVIDHSANNPATIIAKLRDGVASRQDRLAKLFDILRAVGDGREISGLENLFTSSQAISSS